MLLEIRFKNYYGMKNETAISLIAEPLSEHKSSLLNSSCKPSLNVLPIKLLYGSSNSEKRNIILGLKLIQRLISRQHKLTSNDTASMAHSPESPVHLGITVMLNNIIYDYDFAFSNTTFVYEVFKVNSVTLFERKEGEMKISKTPTSISFYDSILKKHLDLTEKLFQNRERLNDKLFLVTIFNRFIDANVIEPFLDYMRDKIIFFDDPKFELTRRKRTLSGYGIEIRDLSTLQNSSEIAKLMLNYCIENGMCFVSTESNYSFNPLEMIPFFKKLHDAILNNNGQLLLSTCQPLYMHKNLIRRDEVCFIYKTHGLTRINNLSQFAVRQENYIKKFLCGEYISSYNYRMAVRNDD